jgi:DNA polymerase III delta prime subunit
MSAEKKIIINKPKEQLTLYGYEKHFNFFSKLFNKKTIPKTILIRGAKGIGKATFCYHFINFLLSKDEKNKYTIENFTINNKNYSFNHILNNTHTNFFLLDAVLNEGNIKIDQVRNLINFLNKSSYGKKLKIVLIDNSELLNINSSNALLKSLEDSNDNTYFFIIENNSSKLLDTIKSRSFIYKIYFTLNEKKKIYELISRNFIFENLSSDIKDYFLFETPGNILKYSLILNDIDLNFNDSILSIIIRLLESVKTKKDIEVVNFVTLMIEKFYTDLSLTNPNNANIYYLNKNKILYMIFNMKNYNLDIKNSIFLISSILKNEK